MTRLCAIERQAVQLVALARARDSPERPMLPARVKEHDRVVTARVA